MAQAEEARVDENMLIWDRVQRTDPAFTKPVTQGRRTYTAISPYYSIRKATELWGPIGVNWGFEIVESRYQEGSPLVVRVGEQDIAIPSQVHTARVRLWYFHNGVRADVEQFGHTPYIYNTAHGPQTDPDAEKKSVTDALAKCLSLCGFNADVYLGMFDDPVYREEAAEIAAIEHADNKVEQEEKARAEFKLYVETHKDMLKKAASLSELEGIYRVVVRKLNYRHEKDLIKEFTSIKDARKGELERTH